MIKWVPLIFLAIGVLGFQSDDFKKKRYNMVKNQIEERGVHSPQILNTFREVKRHNFVQDNYIDQSYDDRPLPIGHGQTISQPYIVAYMTEVIEPDSNDVVLEIGTGSGYQAAILSKIVAEVYTIEIIPELANSAGNRLERLDYENVTVKNADGYYGWKEHAPFDAIVVTAAAEYIPPPLIEQLKNGGKMIIPVGSPFLTQQLTLVKKENDETTTKSIMPVRFVPFRRSE